MLYILERCLGVQKKRILGWFKILLNETDISRYQDIPDVSWPDILHCRKWKHLHLQFLVCYTNESAWSNIINSNITSDLEFARHFISIKRDVIWGWVSPQ